MQHSSPTPGADLPPDADVREAGGERLAAAEGELRALMGELDAAGVPRRLVLRVEEVARWMAVARADGAWRLAVGSKRRSGDDSAAEEG